MDDPENAKSIKEKMQRTDARLLKSPIMEGRKWDANEMLQAGLLISFLGRTLSRECLGIPILMPREVNV